MLPNIVMKQNWISSIDESIFSRETTENNRVIASEEPEESHFLNQSTFNIFHTGDGIFACV